MSDRPRSNPKAARTPELARGKDQPAQVKETLISLIIAFVMAFVFRAFVAEAFVIPTGSMAPTLLGQHVRAQSPETGYNWPVNAPAAPSLLPLTLVDPMTRQEIRARSNRLAGDRILVFKYLYQIYDPRRWDVVVFKAPHDPQTNYIKRLVALPGEEPALIDGDVFIREATPAEIRPGVNTWAMQGWEIKRKPPRVQQTVWQDVYWSQYEPLPAGGFPSPWVGGADWEIADRKSYLYTGSGPAALTWNSGVRPIVDYYPYDQLAGQGFYPVSDVNMAAGVQPGGTLTVSAVVQTRGHEFRADIDGAAVVLRMGRLGPPGPLGHPQAPAEWVTLGTGSLDAPLTAGRITNLEFWHVDQSLSLWADGELVAAGVYDWTPADRIVFSTGLTLEEVYQQGVRAGGAAAVSPLSNHVLYEQPRVRWEFSGGPFELHRVGLQRDIFYQPTPRHAPVRATNPLAALALGPDHFLVLGDNSPLSLDARLWGAAEPWVARQIDGTDGVVPRDLLIGRAFFVYFPALTPGGLGIPVPDFGRMRWIW